MALEKIIIVFLDGVGLGDDDAEANPFVKYSLPFVEGLLDGRRLTRSSAGYSGSRATLLGLDATLGVPGLPQSGTGQTSILTGLNAPTALGEHYGPYPNAQLKAMLARDTLFHRLPAQQKPAAYAGAYPDRFLKRIERGVERLSANTRAALSAGLKLRGPDDLRAGRAISALLTNRYWRSWGYDVPLLTSQQAGEHLLRLSQDHALTYFEIWYTDVIGHKQAMPQAGELLTLLDGFLAGVIEAMDAANTLLLVISDHGNMEDLSTRRHTLNPALALAVGAGHRQAVARLGNLSDITPFVLDLLGRNEGGRN